MQIIYIFLFFNIEFKKLFYHKNKYVQGTTINKK